MANMLRIIQHMKPAKPQDKSLKSATKQDELAQKFPALALPNEEQKPISDKELKDEYVVSSAMASLEELAPSKKSRKEESKKDNQTTDNSEKKIKHTRRSRSRDKKRHRSRSSGRKDRRHKTRSRSRSHERSRSRDRRRHRSRDRKKSRSRDRKFHRVKYSYVSDRSRSRSIEELSMDPEVGKIYSGKVANIVPFGCFVQMEGLKRRWEGLVHISQLRREGRVASASDVVSRGQKVLVKVLNIGGQKVWKLIK